MILDVTLYRFVAEMQANTTENQFSLNGLKALYEELISEEKSLQFEHKLDPVTVACSYTEYENYEALKDDYPWIASEDDIGHMFHTVIKLEDGGFIVNETGDRQK